MKTPPQNLTANQRFMKELMEDTILDKIPPECFNPENGILKCFRESEAEKKPIAKLSSKIK